jgi:phosphoribosylglycinamide formyltransferase-1
VLLDATASGRLDVSIGAVVSHRVGAPAPERAKAADVPAFVLPFGGRHDPSARRRLELALLDLLIPLRPRLVVLAGWMLILSADFLERCPCPLLNVHPALLPVDGDPLEIPVLRGAHAVRDALELRLPYTGVSVHLVTPEVDAGPVVVRERVDLIPGDTEESLYRRIKVVEHRLLPQAVGAVLSALRTGGIYA